MSAMLERLKTVQNNIERLRVRPPNGSSVTLIAVSKTHPAETLIPLLEAGHRDFGENRVQEAQAKWPELKRRFPNVRLHLLGNLQSNKAKEALALFDVIHTVDRESLVDALVKERCQLPVAGCQEFFIQVNTGEEPQKGGIAPLNFSRFMHYVRLATGNRQLVTGLMCVPPANESPAAHFALLRKIAQNAGLAHLSMGMSGDYETAIRLGATHVRVGTAIFGER